MRLFTGIELPDDVNRKLAGLIGRLRPTAPLKWSPAANFHITTKFVGEYPEERLEELEAALRELPARDVIPISVQQLGWFPNPDSPRILWAGVEGGTALAELARDTDQALRRLAIPADNRPFSPHLTLARIKEKVPLDKLKETIAGSSPVQFGSFTASNFFLYLSERGSSGPVYTQLAEFSLEGE